MTLVSARSVPRVLLAADDPLETQLLRSLLRALPEPAPEVLVAETSSPTWTAALSQCDVCLLPLAGDGRPLTDTLAWITAAAPHLRVIGVLGSRGRFGDRVEIVRALRSGLQEIVLLEELSLGSLGELIAPQTTAASLEHHPPTSLTVPPAVQTAVVAPSTEDHTPVTGSWRIALGEQQATFDAATLERLGHAPQTLGNSLGDWKSLIHPDDIDRLVTEVHGVLHGSAPPHPVSYRLRARNGSWVPVVSDDIAVELDEQGAPRAISGRFYEAGANAAASRELVQRPARTVDEDDPQGLLERLSTAVMRLRIDATGVFRVVWCNGAAGALEQRDPQVLIGLRPQEFTPPFDGFDLEQALGRVHQTGIAEVCEAMALGRSEQPHWRSYRISRLDDGEVLLEASDISEHVGQRSTRRMHDEMAQYIVRAWPLTALLVDEHARVVQCISAAGATLGDDPRMIEDRLLGELIGERAGAECRLQIQKTLNTGRIATAVYEVETAEGGRLWLACHSAALRGRPGMPQRALLTVQDVSESVRDLAEARLGREQLRAALRRIPIPLFLKDMDGRYIAINPAFGELYGVEESMLLGKTDLEVFPDELAMELHESDRRLIASGGPLIEVRRAGQGERRSEHCCFGFTVGEPGQLPTGTGCLLLSLDTLPQQAASAATPQPTETDDAADSDGISDATASVVGRVEQVLAEAGNYADVLRRLEQLAETTMNAQALIHEVAGSRMTDAGTAGLTALAPLAQNIVDLERVLLPPQAHLESDFVTGLPRAYCDPLAFHQILLRGIRRARRSLATDGTLTIRLRIAAPSARSCISCGETFGGNHVELVIEDRAPVIRKPAAPGEARHTADAGPATPPPDDISALHTLVHAQGGHLLLRQDPSIGDALHIYFRSAAADHGGEREALSHATVTRFPFVRLRDPRSPS